MDRSLDPVQNLTMVSVKSASESSVPTVSSIQPSPPGASETSDAPFDPVLRDSGDEQAPTNSPDHDSDSFTPAPRTRPRPATRVTIPVVHLTPAPEQEHTAHHTGPATLDRSVSVASLREMFPNLDDAIMYATCCYSTLVFL